MSVERIGELTEELCKLIKELGYPTIARKIVELVDDAIEDSEEAEDFEGEDPEEPEE